MFIILNEDDLQTLTHQSYFIFKLQGIFALYILIFR